MAQYHILINDGILFFSASHGMHTTCFHVEWLSLLGAIFRARSEVQQSVLPSTFTCGEGDSSEHCRASPAKQGVFQSLALGTLLDAFTLVFFFCAAYPFFSNSHGLSIAVHWMKWMTQLTLDSLHWQKNKCRLFQINSNATSSAYCFLFFRDTTWHFRYLCLTLPWYTSHSGAWRARGGAQPVAHRRLLLAPRRPRVCAARVRGHGRRSSGLAESAAQPQPVSARTKRGVLWRDLLRAFSEQKNIKPNVQHEKCIIFFFILLWISEVAPRFLSDYYPQLTLAYLQDTFNLHVDLCLKKQVPHGALRGRVLASVAGSAAAVGMAWLAAVACCGRLGEHLHAQGGDNSWRLILIVAS